jgi:hypothetical protein
LIRFHIELPVHLVGERVPTSRHVVQQRLRSRDSRDAAQHGALMILQQIVPVRNDEPMNAKPTIRAGGRSARIQASVQKAASDLLAGDGPVAVDGAAHCSAGGRDAINDLPALG